MFDFYPAYEHLFAQIQLTLFMIAMGTNVAPRDFIEVARKPRSFLLALFMQLVVLPALVVAINHLGNLEPGIAVGLLLTCVMPGGALSKFFTYMARGNAALSITLSVVLTVGSLATVPTILLTLAGEYMPADFLLPVGRIVVEVAAFLLLPLCVGHLLRKKLARQTPTIARWCVRGGLVMVLAMVVCSLGSGRIEPASYGWGPPLAIILFCILSMQVSMAPFRLLGWPRRDTIAVGIEATMRNMNLALLLKASLFPQNDDLAKGVLFVVLYYAAVAMIAGVPLFLRFRHLAHREHLATTIPSSVK